MHLGRENKAQGSHEPEGRQKLQAAVNGVKKGGNLIRLWQETRAGSLKVPF